jgi:hypothetical protein
MTAAVETHGPDSLEAAREDRRLYALGFVDLAILFAVVWDMTLKPTADDVGTLIIAALIVAAAVANVVRTYRVTVAPAAQPAS